MLAVRLDYSKRGGVGRILLSKVSIKETVIFLELDYYFFFVEDFDAFFLPDAPDIQQLVYNSLIN